MVESAPGLSNYWGGILTIAVVIVIYLFIRWQQRKF